MTPPASTDRSPRPSSALGASSLARRSLPDKRLIHAEGGRSGDAFYRDRWSHDKVVRSTHGVNCTGSCSWKVYVKDGIITWEAQQTDYPSTGADRPEYEPRGLPPRAPPSAGTPTRPTRVRYPYVRGVLLEMYREAKRAVGGDPVVAWASDRPGPREGEALQVGPRQGRPGPLDVGRGRRDHRGRPRLHRQALGPGPDRRLLADPRDVPGLLCLGSPLPRAHRRPDALVLRLVRRPAQRLAADVRRPDRRARVGRLVGCRLPHHVGIERADDAHARRALDDRGALPRPEGRRGLPRLRRERQVRRRVGRGGTGHRRGARDGHGPRHPQGVLRRPAGRLLHRLQPEVHRPALPRRPRARHHGCRVGRRRGRARLPPGQVPRGRRPRHPREHLRERDVEAGADRRAHRRRRHPAGLDRLPLRRGGLGEVEPRARGDRPRAHPSRHHHRDRANHVAALRLLRRQGRARFARGAGAADRRPPRDHRPRPHARPVRRQPRRAAGHLAG